MANHYRLDDLDLDILMWVVNSYTLEEMGRKAQRSVSFIHYRVERLITEGYLTRDIQRPTDVDRRHYRSPSRSLKLTAAGQEFTRANGLNLNAHPPEMSQP